MGFHMCQVWTCHWNVCWNEGKDLKHCRNQKKKTEPHKWVWSGLTHSTTCPQLRKNPKTKRNNSTNFSYIEWKNHTYRKTISKNNAKVALSRTIMKFDGHKPDTCVNLYIWPWPDVQESRLKNWFPVSVPFRGGFPMNQKGPPWNAWNAEKQWNTISATTWDVSRWQCAKEVCKTSSGNQCGLTPYHCKYFLLLYNKKNIAIWV